MTSDAGAPGGPGHEGRSPRGWHARLPALVTGLCSFYAAVVLGVCLLLHLASDRWWVATLVLFGPRWPLV